MSVIQSLWIGDTISIMERLAMVSFLKNGHIFHLYAYNNIKNLPEGIVVKDANKIIPENKIFKYKEFNSYAGFANMFRYKLLYEKGGYWVDTDVICLKTFDFEEDYVFAGFRVKKRILGYKVDACNCIIKSPIKSKIMEFCYNESVSKNPNDLYWGETGPDLLTKATKIFNKEKYITKPNVFCPVNWFEHNRLLSKNNGKLISKSYAVHMWNEVWRRNNNNKNDKYPKESIYEKLKLRYGFD